MKRSRFTKERIIAVLRARHQHLNGCICGCKNEHYILRRGPDLALDRE